MSLFAWVAVAGIAAYRITRLLVIDTLFEEPRDALQRWLGRGDGFFRQKLLELTLCPYCVGVWVSAAVWLVIAHYEGWDLLHWPEQVVLVAAIAGVQATLQSANAALEAASHEE